jgi:hypothetical protein
MLNQALSKVSRLRRPSRMPFQLPRGMIQNHHLRELASMT